MSVCETDLLRVFKASVELFISFFLTTKDVNILKSAIVELNRPQKTFRPILCFPVGERACDKAAEMGGHGLHPQGPYHSLLSV